MNLKFVSYSSMFFCLFTIIGCQLALPKQTKQEMLIYVTVDWEGASLDEQDIETMQLFRKKFPNIPMLQLINPAYFVRMHGDNHRLKDIIQSTFLPADKQGLHVHAWKSLMTYCGIPYQDKPSFSDVKEDCETGDCGYTVSLEYAYTEEELTRLIACSNAVLQENGFEQSVHFRAGGWQMGPKLIAALESNGFVWDSSKIDADLLTTRWHEQSGIIQMLRQLHPNTTFLDQPYPLSGTLIEYPNNAALADYTSSKQIVQLFKRLVNANKKVMVLGFHQETATDFLDRLEAAVPQIEQIAQEKNIQLKWVSQ